MSCHAESFPISGRPHPGSFGTSPPSRFGFGTSPPSSVLGTSPPGSLGARADKQAPYADAKKFWKRICFDPSLEPSEYTVGYVESVEHQVRQSGVGAWSMRVHEQLQDIPFDAFVGKFHDEDIPFHRIAYFKHRLTMVWESDYFKDRRGSRGGGEGEAAAGSFAAAAAAAAARSRRTSGAGSSDAKLPPLLGGSPETRRLFFPTGVSGDLLGGSSDGDDDDDDESSREWDQDDLVAGEMDGDGLPCQHEEPVELQLPEQCWLKVLFSLGVRDICMMGRVNRWLRELSSCPELWQEQYERLFGEEPQPSYNAATVRRMCRRSEIRAARWLEADTQEQHVGFPNTTCLQLDDTKVVSGDGQSVRVWSHETGKRYRRIATLAGHTGLVTCVAYDDNLVLSGCGQGMVKVWGMDDLKCSRTFRAAHNGQVTGVALMNGIPVSAGSDACVRLWDVAAGQPIMVLESPRARPLLGLEVQHQSSKITSCGDGVHIWDASSMTLLHDLGLPHHEGAAADDDATFKCVTSSDSVLAAGLGDQVVLWDPRCAAVIGAVPAPAQPGAGARSACAAVQLDDWKLMAAFNSGPAEGRLALYDMRAMPSLRSSSSSSSSAVPVPGPRLQPLQVLRTPGRVYSMKFHNLMLMVGLANLDCSLWTFRPPGAQLLSALSLGPDGLGGGSPPLGSSLADAAAHESLGSSPPASGFEDPNRRRKGKPPKVVKKQNRYPKRSK